MKEIILTLILSVSIEAGVPPEFVTAIALENNLTEQSIQAEVEHIRWLAEQLHYCTWFSVAIAYNAGIDRVWSPPWSAIEYANKVVAKMYELSGEGMYFDPRVVAYEQAPFRRPTERLESDFDELYGVMPYVGGR